MHPLVHVVGLIAAVALAACGRFHFDTCSSDCRAGDQCVDDAECTSGHCVAGVCCDSACSGTCDECTTGTCMPVPAACQGDCASCEPDGTGFHCVPAPAACAATCTSATCVGTGTMFSCDMSSCCSTETAPNRAGSCATGPVVQLGDGCRFVYDYSSWISANNFVELDWNEQICQQGVWVEFDVGADAIPCTGCAHETRNAWSDTCGNASAFVQVCP